MTALPQETSPQCGGKRLFLTNVLWSWLGVGANLLVALVVQRYVIRSLGEERYGIWTLVFSTLDYFWFFDLD